MLEWVKDIAMFLVISRLLLEMIAETKYYKFARWVTGIILILQLIRPLAETQDLWGRFVASFQSFDYAISSDKVLEEIYTVSDKSAQSVLSSYKESICVQVEQILNKNSLTLLSADIEVADNGELLKLAVYGAYTDGTQENAGQSEIRIPTVVPVKIEEKEETTEVLSPLEIYIRDILAEFYQVDANRIEVELQEAAG